MKNKADWTNIRIASPYDDSPDAEMAAEEELSYVANNGQLPEVQRFNPNLPYADITMKFNPSDQVLLAAIKKAIGAGWEGWRSRVNDATTIGMEAEQLVLEMKKRNADVKGLLFDIDFARFVWGDDWEEQLKNMAITPNVIEYLKRCLS